uniref:Putative cuticle protein CPG30 n=1 Tax=Bombyx mori TaxID=7091 RepID=D0VEM5_BOMMO|nr:putative cuticle protein CPG30 [Bombyx mori]
MNKTIKAHYNAMDLKTTLVLFAVVSTTSSQLKSPDRIFESAYSECLMKFSYVCLQRKTLSYLKVLNGLSEVSVFGDYVKFVKFNSSKLEEDKPPVNTTDTAQLASLIDEAVDNFFATHTLRVKALGRELSMTRGVNEFVGRKKRKGGGGGGDHGGDHDGKKKMMMMAMMCMKMKMMMMIPAMMGMMGMMSFKGMMFSMMSFMISKGWATSGAGGGAWMPAGSQDYAGGGGYDANGQWQSRSILEKEKRKPIVTSIASTVRINGKTTNANEIIKENGMKEIKHRLAKRNVDALEIVAGKKEIAEDISSEIPGTDDREKLTHVNRFDNDIVEDITLDNDSNWKTSILIGKLLKKSAVNELKTERNSRNGDASTDDNVKCNTQYNPDGKPAVCREYRRKKRDIIDIFQNSYRYILSKLFGTSINRRTVANPKYKIVNGVKYVYQPFRASQKVKIIAAEDFNKGEIMEGAVESRMNRKKFNRIKDNVNETMDDNPWE